MKDEFEGERITKMGEEIREKKGFKGEKAGKDGKGEEEELDLRKQMRLKEFSSPGKEGKEIG